MATGSDDKTIKIWNLDSGKCIRTLVGHTGSVYSIQLLPKNQLLTGSNDETIKTWNFETGECVLTFKGRTGLVNSFQFLSTANSLLDHITIKPFKYGTWILENVFEN